MRSSSDLLYAARAARPFEVWGHVIGIKGPVVTAALPSAAIGDLCVISTRSGKVTARVVGFQGETASLAPFHTPDGVGAGYAVLNTGRSVTVSVPAQPQGWVLDALGVPLTRGCGTYERVELPLHSPPPEALCREPIRERFESGVNVIDAMCTIGQGQRLGLFAPAGAGKSTLLGMLARHADADACVIGLIGERGREVREFIENILGPAGRSRSVLVVSTSDESAVRRCLASYTATSIAEYLRSRGQRVLLLVDSLTRVVRAMREIGLAAGELPVRHGYTPSVYSELPCLLERPGRSAKGSITAIYSILTNEESPDPIDEEIKSILDGHLSLSRWIALQGTRPALDLTASISRVMSALNTPDHMEAVEAIVALAARLKKDRDLLLFGGKADPELELALESETNLRALLHQRLDDAPSPEETRRQILQHGGRCRERRRAIASATSGESR